MPAHDRPVRTARLLRERYGHAPVRVAEVLAAGWTAGQLRAAIKAGLLVSPVRGMVCVAGPVDELEAYARQVAACQRRMRSDIVAADASAATLLRLPAPRPGPVVPDAVTLISASSTRRGNGLRVRRGEVPPQDRVLVRGVVCTSLPRTAIDLARGRPLPESLVVLDAALRRLTLADPECPPGETWKRAQDPAATARARAELLACYDRLAPTWHAASLRAAIDLADPRAETPLESASRGLVLEAGLPAPDLQVWVRGDDGRWYRCDLGWHDHRVLGEGPVWLGSRRFPARFQCGKRREPSRSHPVARRLLRLTGSGPWQVSTRSP